MNILAVCDLHLARTRAAIKRIQPRYAFCGPIHDSWGSSGQIGATRVVNLDPTVNWFEIAP